MCCTWRPTLDQIFSFIKKIKGIFKNPPSIKVKWKKHYTASNKKKNLNTRQAINDWTKLSCSRRLGLQDKIGQNCPLEEDTVGKGAFLFF